MPCMPSARASNGDSCRDSACAMLLAGGSAILVGAVWCVCGVCDTTGGMRKNCASSMMISFKSDRRHASTTSFLLLPPPPLAALLTTPSAPQRHKQPWHQLQLHQRHRPGHALRPSCTSSPITCPPSTGPSTAAWCSIMEVSSGLGCAGHSSRHLRTLASASTP